MVKVEVKMMMSCWSSLNLFDLGFQNNDREYTPEDGPAGASQYTPPIANGEAFHI